MRHFVLCLMKFRIRILQKYNLASLRVLQVVRICPFITVLNVVTEDPMLESFAAMENVKRAQIELEDCFGLGLHSYLQKMGGKLEELVISCSSGENCEIVSVNKRKLWIPIDLRWIRG